MRVIIAGDRNITDYNILLEAIRMSDFNITTVLSGKARGADALGERWAKENKIPIEEFPAQWGKFFRSAGVVRNRVMASMADGLIALWDGHSKGTANMIQQARSRNLHVYVHMI